MSAKIATLKLKFNIIAIFQQKRKLNPPPGEPHNYHLGEVLQRRSKAKFNIILSYMIVLFFGGSDFHNTKSNIEMSKISYFINPCTIMIQNISIGNFQTS